MTTKERIEQDAKKYAINHSAAPDKETPDWIIQDFVSGAKSERNITIDEAIAVITDYQTYNYQVVERLKAMKI